MQPVDGKRNQSMLNFHPFKVIIPPVSMETVSKRLNITVCVWLSAAQPSRKWLCCHKSLVVRDDMDKCIITLHGVLDLDWKKPKSSAAILSSASALNCVICSKIMINNLGVILLHGFVFYHMDLCGYLVSAWIHIKGNNIV